MAPLFTPAADPHPDPPTPELRAIIDLSPTLHRAVPTAGLAVPTDELVVPTDELGCAPAPPTEERDLPHRMSRNSITPALEQELAAIAEETGCELVHVGFKGGTLQIMLDHPDGVTHAHCEAVSKQASAFLDVEDFGSGRYVLEVTSPGLDRPLYRPADYRRFVGRRVRVTFHHGPERAKRTIVGELESFDDGDEIASVREADSGDQLRIPLRDIQSARLQIEL